MASLHSLLHLLLLFFTLSLLSTATALRFSENAYDFFPQDLSRAFCSAPLLAPSLPPSPTAYAAANRTSDETIDGPLVSSFFIGDFLGTLSRADRVSDDYLDLSRATSPLLPPSLSPSPAAYAAANRTSNETAFFICDFLGTLLRADGLPYGRDLETLLHTDRFCNGRLAVHYLVLHLGLPLVPVCLGHNKEDLEVMMHGVTSADVSGLLKSPSLDASSSQSPQSPSLPILFLLLALSAALPFPHERPPPKNPQLPLLPDMPPKRKSVSYKLKQVFQCLMHPPPAPMPKTETDSKAAPDTKVEPMPKTDSAPDTKVQKAGFWSKAKNFFKR